MSSLLAKWWYMLPVLAPASSRMSTTVVASYPRSANRRSAASRMASRRPAALAALMRGA